MAQQQLDWAHYQLPEPYFPFPQYSIAPNNSDLSYPMMGDREDFNRAGIENLRDAMSMNLRSLRNSIPHADRLSTDVVSEEFTSLRQKYRKIQNAIRKLRVEMVQINNNQGTMVGNYSYNPMEAHVDNTHHLLRIQYMKLRHVSTAISSLFDTNYAEVSFDRKSLDPTPQAEVNSGHGEQPDSQELEDGDVAAQNLEQLATTDSVLRRVIVEQTHAYSQPQQCRNTTK